MTSTETTDAGQQGNADDQTGSGQQTGGQQQDQQSEPQDVKSLPKWAQDLIKEIRGEAASHRTKASQLEQASQKQLDAIAQALGLKQGTEVDPAKLKEQLDAARGAERSTKVELAVYRLAGKHHGDPDALLDSRSFLAAVADLDPADSDFAKKIEKAIKDAVADNPKLKAAQTPARSGGDGPPGGGSGGRQRPTGLGAAVAAALNT